MQGQKIGTILQAVYVLCIRESFRGCIGEIWQGDVKREEMCVYV